MDSVLQLLSSSNPEGHIVVALRGVPWLSRVRLKKEKCHSVTQNKGFFSM